MNFLADENFPLVSVRLLRNAGHNVVSIIEETPGDQDRDVLKRAHEENRIVLTFDKDYGELIYRHRVFIPAGLVYFRFNPATPEEPADMLVLDYIVKGSTRIIIRIRNDGRGSAIAPYLWVKFPPGHGININGADGNGNWNLPPLLSRDLTDFGGTTQHVIHPGTAIEVFVFQRNDNKDVVGPQEIQYGVAAMDVPLREDKLLIYTKE